MAQRGSLEGLIDSTNPGDGDELMKRDPNEMSPFDQSVGEDTDELLGLKSAEEEDGDDTEESEEESQETKSDDQEEEGEEEEQEQETKGAEGEEGEEDEDGVAEDDIDAAIEKHLRNRGEGEGEDKRRKLLMGGQPTGQQQQQTQQTQEQAEESEVKPFDYAPSKAALVKRFGEDYADAADQLQVYLEPIIEQAGANMRAMIYAEIGEIQKQQNQVNSSYAQLANDFYEAYPELNTPGGRKLVMANTQEIMESGRQFKDDGAMLYEVGEKSLKDLEKIKGGTGKGGEGKKKTKTSKRTKAESLGKSKTRTQRQEEGEEKRKNASDASMDKLFDYAADRYNKTGVQGFLN